MVFSKRSLLSLILVVVPLYPAATINTKESQPAQRWILRRTALGGHRWQPENASSSNDSVLGAHNDRLSTLPYTDVEYNEHLAVDGWSREETDYFFTLCNQYFNRLIIVASHYEYTGAEGSSIRRTVEDLRERYYYVIGKISALRGSASSSASSTFLYDKEGDRHRRLILDGFQARPKEQLEEETLLADAMSTMRITLPSVLQMREKLLLCCGGLGQHLLAHAPTLPELCGGGVPSTTGSGSAKNRKGSAGEKSKKNTLPTTTAAAGSSSSRKRKKQRPSTKPPPTEGDSEIYGTSPPTTHAGPGRKPKPSLAHTFARSTSLRPIRVGLTRHVDKMLLEMGLAIRPVMPTVAVCERFNELRCLLAKQSDAQKSIGASSTGVTTPTPMTNAASGSASRHSEAGPSRAESPTLSSSATTKAPVPKRPK